MFASWSSWVDLCSVGRLVPSTVGHWALVLSMQHRMPPQRPERDNSAGGHGDVRLSFHGIAFAQSVHLFVKIGRPVTVPFKAGLAACSRWSGGYNDSLLLQILGASKEICIGLNYQKADCMPPRVFNCLFKYHSTVWFNNKLGLFIASGPHEANPRWSANYGDTGIYHGIPLCERLVMMHDMRSATLF